MRFFRLRTIRAKLIATTMAVFGLLLLTLGFLLSATSRQALMSTIDSDLKERGVQFADGFGRRSHRGPPPDPRPNRHEPDVRSRQRPQPRKDPQGVAPDVIFLTSETGRSGPKDQAYDYEGFLRAASGESNFRTDVANGDPRRVFSTPIRRNGHIEAVVQIAGSLGPALAALRSQQLTMLRVELPLGLILGAFASLVVVQRLLNPLRHLNAEAERIGSEGFGKRLEPQGNDEFASLVGTLNGMLYRLESHYRLEREANVRLQSTLDQQRRFTSDASHELKTPLSIIKAHIGILKHSQGAVSAEMESILSIDAGANRMATLVRDLLVLARMDSGPIESRQLCQLAKVIEDAICAVPEGRERTQFERGDDACVVGAPSELFRLFSNLIENAIKHSGTVPPILIALRTDETKVTVSVEDHGIGISPEHLPHVFERFYRTDRSRASDTGGSGLGLAICEQIARSHGGGVTVVSEEGRGTTFTVWLPRGECLPTA